MKQQMVNIMKKNQENQVPFMINELPYQANGGEKTPPATPDNNLQPTPSADPKSMLSKLIGNKLKP